jgi:hypothetical protein
MPNVTLDGANLPQTDWNPPAADVDFNQLFASDEDGRLVADNEPLLTEETVAEPTTETTTEPAAHATEATETQPQTAPARESKKDEFFLKTETGTVYKNSDDAARGIAEKDRIINDLRSKVRALAGVDPLKNESVSDRSQTGSNRSYFDDDKSFVDDLAKAASEASRGNPRAYRDTLVSLVDQTIQSRLGQYLPVVEKVGILEARQDAINSISAKNPAIKEFVGSEDYEKALEEVPSLRQAISNAEKFPQYRETLPELLNATWKIALANKTPELIKGNSPNTNPAPRMPMSGSRLAPPTGSNTSQNAKPTMTTSAGRKALMADLEARGVLDKIF